MATTVTIALPRMCLEPTTSVDHGLSGPGNGRSRGCAPGGEGGSGVSGQDEGAEHRAVDNRGTQSVLGSVSSPVNWKAAAICYGDLAAPEYLAAGSGQYVQRKRASVYDEAKDLDAARKRKRKHPYEELAGEALDDHMRALHGWSRLMIAGRGTKTLAQNYHYVGNWHHSAHGTPPRPEPEADQ